MKALRHLWSLHHLGPNTGNAFCSILSTVAFLPVDEQQIVVVGKVKVGQVGGGRLADGENAPELTATGKLILRLHQLVEVVLIQLLDNVPTGGEAAVEVLRLVLAVLKKIKN